jgi:hypothetical protein
VVPRVIKHALGRQAIAAYVQDHIGLSDPDEVSLKIRDLERANMLTFWPVLLTAWHPWTPQALRDTFGEPQFIMPDPPHPLPPGDTILGASYTQNYVQPVAKLFSRLNFRRPAHRELAYGIIDQYVQLQQELARYGFFDVDFKLTDNYGVREDGKLTVMDFSELALQRSTVQEVVTEAAWLDLPRRREYTQLPPKFQRYFSQQLAKHITLDSLEDWGSERIDQAPIDTFATPNMLFDLAGQELWRQRPNRYYRPTSATSASNIFPRSTP